MDRLANRTVLIVHPFDASIRTQYARRERVWPGERGARILPALQLRTVQPVSSISGWRPDANWSQVGAAGSYAPLAARALTLPAAVSRAARVHPPLPLLAK